MWPDDNGGRPGPRSRDPAPPAGGNIGRVDGKSMSAANNLRRNSREPDGLSGARSSSRIDRKRGGRAAEATGTIRADSYRHDFPWIHDVVRIERALDGGHGR